MTDILLSGIFNLTLALALGIFTVVAVMFLVVNLFGLLLMIVACLINIIAGLYLLNNYHDKMQKKLDNYE